MMLMTQSQAARSLGITRQAVAAAVMRGALIPGNLDALLHANAPAMFTAEEVERYRVVNLGRRRGGRPRKATA
jgi:hypothetical protein